MPWDWQVRWSARCRIFEGFEGSTQTILTIDLFDAVDMMRILVVSRDQLPTLANPDGTTCISNLFGYTDLMVDGVKVPHQPLNPYTLYF